jgi:hypothetical protein
MPGPVLDIGSLKTSEAAQGGIHPTSFNIGQKVELGRKGSCEIFGTQKFLYTVSSFSTIHFFFIC